MQVKIVCFSQTGNTRKVAKAMAGALRESGNDVRWVPFEKIVVEDFCNSDLIGVGAPCFESQAPTPVRQFLDKLPSLEHTNAFVFATSGGAPGRVLRDLANPLRAKGARILGGFLCRGTCFHPVPCLAGRFPERPNQTDIENARRFARSLVALIENSDTRGQPEENRSDLLATGFGLYDLAGLVLKDDLVRFLMPKPEVDTDKCNQCEWCVHECPTKSMALDPVPAVSKTCIRCYRCLTGCPQKALSVNWWISNMVTWSLYNETFERWFGDIRIGEKSY
jgi:flavodoxin/NAD-dependent dihydropyrimidine dehydrogenase PreA subunit